MLTIGERQEPSLRPLLVIIIIIVSISVYFVVSALSGDPLWLSRRFEATPTAIIVHCYGESFEVDPQSQYFSGITNVVNRTLTGRKRWDPLSLSEQTYQDYQTRSDAVALELYYPEPLRIHTNTRLYSNVSNIVIPLEGRHADTQAIFGRHQGLSTGGSLHVESTAPIRNYLALQDLCARKE